MGIGVSAFARFRLTKTFLSSDTVVPSSGTRDPSVTRAWVPGAHFRWKFSADRAISERLYLWVGAAWYAPAPVYGSHSR